MVSSVKLEVTEETHYVAELHMPIAVFWEVKDLLNQADYLLANSDDRIKVNDLYRKVFKKCSKYAALEKDRLWLLRHSNVTAS